LPLRKARSDPDDGDGSDRYCGAEAARTFFELSCPLAVLTPDRQQLVATLVLLITAPFIGSLWIKSPWRVWRRAVIIGYLLTIDLILAWVTEWFLGL